MSTKSSRVWESRNRNAHKLAEMGDGNEEKAMSLILRTIRYALADAHEFERENTSERYRNSRAHEHKAELLGRRRANLEREWNEYGLTMVNYGPYPTINDLLSGTQDVIHLAYFD
jgi:DNA invertase Pin-like site-specific DNA recombinase